MLSGTVSILNSKTLTLCFFLLVPAPRPNCEPKFDVFRDSDPILLDSPSPLRREAWRRLLSSYPGNLPLLLDGILTFGARLGYEGPEQFILSRNLPIELPDHDVLDKKAAADLAAGLIAPITPKHPCMVSPLGVVPKGDGGRRRIHHLSYPEGESVNDLIPAEYASITYVTFDAIVADVLQAGRGCTIIKRDIRDAFRMVPVATNDRWLLGFGWKGVFYTERALPFGLCTAPFLFNLFAEGLHWILLSHGWRRLHHYLDDFISIFSSAEVAAGHAVWATNDWIQVTNDLGVPRKDSKDEFGTTVPVFGIEVDTLAMEARLPREKMDKLRHMVSKPLQSGWTSQKEIESLAGLMSFCSRVVRLGRTFSQSSYDFIADAARNRRSGTVREQDSLRICRGGTTFYMNSMAYVLLTTPLDQLRTFTLTPVTTAWAALYLKARDWTCRPPILLLVAGPTHAFEQSILMLRKPPRRHTL